MLKFYRLLPIICAVLMLTVSQAKAQTDKDARPAPNSTLSGVKSPAGAQRINDGSIPAEITNTLGKLIAMSDGKLSQGGSEVLIWTGSNYRRSNANQLIKQFTENLQSAGWSYEVGEHKGDYTVFSSINAGKRRGFVGFWVLNDEALLLAWTEILTANASNTGPSQVNQTVSGNPSRHPISNNTGNVLRVGANTDYVNVMGDEMPPIPEFPALTKKTGFIRGYVKDSLGHPVAGAKLGLKSARIYDGYLAASAETDAKGFYEIKIPMGGARFDYAGFTIVYGSGRAALGLHPADGSLSESYPAAAGAVENFVLLPFGIADADGMSSSPRYRGNYYGGTMMLRYFIAPAGQNPNDFGGMLAAGSEIVVTLKLVGDSNHGSQSARAFEIRKTVEDSSLGEFYICNVPVGRYEIQVKQANGKALRIKQKSPTGSIFGIQPTETASSAQLVFNPLSADAKTAVASRGNCTDLEIIVERP